MIPLVFPVEPPCADQPYLAVSLPDGGSFGWPGLAFGRDKTSWKPVAAAGGVLACPDTPAYSTCEYVIPMESPPPTQVFAIADREIFVRYECGPTFHQPRAHWLLDRDASPSVSYALDAPVAMPKATGSDARDQLAKARAVLSACDATRCTPAVEARRKALDAALASDWSVGKNGVIETTLDWATVAYTCHAGEHTCTTELLFYDSSIVAYVFDEGDVAHRAWWDGGSVSVTEQLLQLDGAAVRLREP